MGHFVLLLRKLGHSEMLQSIVDRLNIVKSRKPDQALYLIHQILKLIDEHKLAMPVVVTKRKPIYPVQIRVEDISME